MLREGRNAAIILAIAAATFFGVSFVVQWLDCELGKRMERDHRDSRSYLNVAKDGFYIEPHPLRKRYPEIFKARRVIVTFSASWCGPCKRQLAAIKRNVKGHAFVEAPIETDQGEPTKWADLKSELGYGEEGIPLTIVFEKGVEVAKFNGYVPWREILDHVE